MTLHCTRRFADRDGIGGETGKGIVVVFGAGSFELPALVICGGVPAGGGEERQQGSEVLFAPGEARNQQDVAARRVGGSGLMGGKVTCLLYTSPSPRDRQKPRMPSS